MQQIPLKIETKYIHPLAIQSTLYSKITKTFNLPFSWFQISDKHAHEIKKNIVVNEAARSVEARQTTGAKGFLGLVCGGRIDVASVKNRRGEIALSGGGVVRARGIAIAAVAAAAVAGSAKR